MKKKTVKCYSDIFPGRDIILYFGEICSDVFVNWLYKFRDYTRAHKKQDGATVIISTPGGSPDDAFRMMRLLQEKYKAVDVIVIGACYSAGTLFALGADTIYMSDGATLGPLDVQIRKEDDISRMSGECYRRALYDVSMTANMIFTQNFSKLKLNRHIPLSTSTASKIASDIAVGLLSPITSRIEPIKLGEMMRSQMIGVSYGRRLMARRYSAEDANDILSNLSSGYPSHGTVIDYAEAKHLGLRVESFNIIDNFEGSLLQMEKDMVLENYPAKPIIRFLNEEKIG